eukprot:1160692-Pelagomonas_calceolata.AAC.4
MDKVQKQWIEDRAVRQLKGPGRSHTFIHRRISSTAIPKCHLNCVTLRGCGKNILNKSYVHATFASLHKAISISAIHNSHLISLFAPTQKATATAKLTTSKHWKTHSASLANPALVAEAREIEKHGYQGVQAQTPEGTAWGLA